MCRSNYDQSSESDHSNLIKKRAILCLPDSFNGTRVMSDRRYVNEVVQTIFTIQRLLFMKNTHIIQLYIYITMYKTLGGYMAK